MKKRIIDIIYDSLEVEDEGEIVKIDSDTPDMNIIIIEDKEDEEIDRDTPTIR